MKMRPSLLLAALALTGCATSAAPRPEALPTPVLAQAPAGVAEQAPTRRERMARILSHNVRLFIYDGGQAKKTASGVVVGTEVSSAGVVSYILTNAHALDTTGMSAPELRVLVDRPWEEGGAEAMDFLGAPVAVGKVPEMDLALIRVLGIRLEPVQLALAEELVPGDAVVVAAAPFGRIVSLSGGLISALEWDRKSRSPTLVKTDAAIGYGASGGGIYSVETGKLLAIVEGYRTAKIGFAVQEERFSFDVPMPGETFAAPSNKVRDFLQQNGYAHLLEGAPQTTPRTAAR
jgi:serine protease Do